MIIIKSVDEFINFYPYEEKYIDEYPKEYPCICKWEYEGGGLTGDIRQVYVAYYPQNLNINETFELGLKNPWLKLK